MTDEKKKDRVLSEVESLKIDVVNLQQQNLELQKKLIDTQKALITAQETAHKLRSEMMQSTHSELLEKLELSGEINLSKQEDGLYKVIPQEGK